MDKANKQTNQQTNKQTLIRGNIMAMQHYLLISGQ